MLKLLRSTLVLLACMVTTSRASDCDLKQEKKELALHGNQEAIGKALLSMLFKERFDRQLNLSNGQAYISGKSFASVDAVDGGSDKKFQPLEACSFMPSWDNPSELLDSAQVYRQDAKTVIVRAVMTGKQQSPTQSSRASCKELDDLIHKTVHPSRLKEIWTASYSGSRSTSWTVHNYQNSESNPGITHYVYDLQKGWCSTMFTFALSCDDFRHHVQQLCADTLERCLKNIQVYQKLLVQDVAQAQALVEHLDCKRHLQSGLHHIAQQEAWQKYREDNEARREQLLAIMPAGQK